MEGEKWEEVDLRGMDGWTKGEEMDEDDMKIESLNEEDLKENVFPEDSTTQKEEIHAEKEYVGWQAPPASLNVTTTQNNVPRFKYPSQMAHDFEGGYVKTQKKLIAKGEIVNTNVGFGQSLRRMVREAWGSTVPMSRGHLRTPVSKVRFTQTGTQFCTTTEECMAECCRVQKYYMDLGFPDIPYNFMIGGDGVLYHGRGWLKTADRSPTYFRLKKNCVDVAYIGDFTGRRVPYEMLATGADFMKYGLKISRLTPFFQSFTHLDTYDITKTPTKTNRLNNY